MLALHYCTDSVTHATSLAFTVRYADVLRRCVTVRYGGVCQLPPAFGGFAAAEGGFAAAADGTQSEASAES